jgi:hypothetical protein
MLGRGQIAIFLLADRRIGATDGERQAQYAAALYRDSKVTGPDSDFCLGPQKFVGVNLVVFCDLKHFGWVNDPELRVAKETGRLPIVVQVVGSGQ